MHDVVISVVSNLKLSSPYMQNTKLYSRQLSSLTVDSPTGTANGFNEYNMDLSVGAGVHMRTHLGVPASSHVRGSFIRQITEDFIVPLKHITLLTKIGEG